MWFLWNELFVGVTFDRRFNFHSNRNNGINVMDRNAIQRYKPFKNSILQQSHYRLLRETKNLLWIIAILSPLSLFSLREIFTRIEKIGLKSRKSKWTRGCWTSSCSIGNSFDPGNWLLQSICRWLESLLVCSCFERAKGRTPWETGRERARRTRIRHGVVGVCAATRLFAFHSLHEDPRERAISARPAAFFSPLLHALPCPRTESRFISLRSKAIVSRFRFTRNVLFSKVRTPLSSLQSSSSYSAKIDASFLNSTTRFTRILDWIYLDEAVRQD